jgi:adenine-specific DNA-methyltransferase
MAKAKIIHGEAGLLLDDNDRKFDFIFLDPPFNIGQKYKGFEDQWKSDGDYEYWLSDIVCTCWRDLKPDGVMACHGPDKLADIYIRTAHEERYNRIAWINWHYRFGQNKTSNWIDARCHCLIYAKGTTYTWNPDDVLVESDRVKYGDRRVQAKNGLRLPGTVWGVPSDGPYWGRVSGSRSNRERRPNHPNQLPELYIARLLKAYTKPGDWVLDAFTGSGTVPTVAKALGRNCIAFDISKESVRSARRRVKQGAVRI